MPLGEIHQKARDGAIGDDGVLEPELHADVLVLGVLDAHGDALEPQLLADQPGDDVVLIIVAQAQQQAARAGIGLAQDGGLAPVSLDVAAVEPFRELVDPLPVALDDDHLVATLEELSGGHHGERAGPHDHDSHDSTCLLPIQVPG